jgi:purine-binding chemotaxis protein CheW
MIAKRPEAPKKRAAVVDWREVDRRLEVARAAIDRVWTLTTEETQRILRARAESLAREPTPMTAAAETIEVVEFMLAYERYAVESGYVRDVHALDSLTPLPCTPAFVLGIVNLRGEILSVIDLGRFFDLPRKGLTDLNKAIVLRSGTMQFGVLADTVVGMRRVPVTDIQPSLPTLTGVREEFLKGVTSERLVILDGEKLLTDKSIVVQEQVVG